MAIYICEECGDFKDGDWFPCAEHPETGEQVCEECLPDFSEPEQKEYNSDDKHALSISLEESFGKEGWLIASD